LSARAQTVPARRDGSGLSLDQEIRPATPPQIKRPSWRLRISSWLPVIASAVLSLFWLAFIVFLVIMITENDNRLFFGLAGETRPWFTLVMIFLLATLLMIISAILGWARQYGSIWRRLYYTLLTLAAVTITIVLAAWGIVTTMF
jgi:hypothetical protein